MKIKSLIAFLGILLSSFAFAKIVSTDSLATHHYWLKLGHYRSAYLTEWKSDVDNNQFFLSPLGKTDPAAELAATIKAFNGEGLTLEQIKHNRCQFPARFNWLKSKVDNNWQTLDCPELNTWRKVINPSGVTLVFPTAYMNSPSSMFGHTLLRIDAKDQTRDKELVAFAVNFAAEPDGTDNAAMYALKGLIGSYPGNFTLMPYYRKVREYNDIESRDIWEYKLNLSTDEVELILLHLWELQSATFDYYFIDENCSYQLLALLQLARESLDLTSSFTMQAIPSDTVAVLRDKDLLQAPKYRAAFGTRLYHYSTQMTDEQLHEARRLMAGEPLNISDYSEQQQVAIIEIAYEWLNFEFYDQGLERDKIAPRLTQLLHKRSQYKVASPLSMPVKPNASPEQGHDSSRVGLSYTDSKDNQPLTGFSYRLAYHDLLDNPAGFIPGAQISFLDIEGTIDSNGSANLERLYLLDAMSLATDNRIFDSWSWNLRMGFERQPDHNARKGRWFTQAGYGKSAGDPNHLHGYILGSLELNGGDISKGVTVGFGSEAGIVWRANLQHKFAISGNYFWLTDNNKTKHSELKLTWNWSLLTNFSLRTELKSQQWRDENNTAKISMYYYF